ncbi:MAG TPA: hypothetical protein VGE67_17685 [Haloferula sp.]
MSLVYHLNDMQIKPISAQQLAPMISGISLFLVAFIDYKIDGVYEAGQPDENGKRGQGPPCIVSQSKLKLIGGMGQTLLELNGEDADAAADMLASEGYWFHERQSLEAHPLKGLPFPIGKMRFAPQV